MGANSVLGLLFEISADPSKAAEAMKQFETSTGQSLQRTAGATKPLNDSLLSSRESARLLSEEMGIHLPRAVSSAIGEMLPAIGSLGGALLGAFAVREVIEFGEYVKKDADAVEGLADAEKRMQEAAKENFEAFKNFSREQLQVELNRTNIRIGAEEREYQHARHIAENEAALLPGVWHVYDTLFQTHLKENEAETKRVLDSDTALMKQLTSVLEQENQADARAHEKVSKAIKDHITWENVLTGAYKVQLDFIEHDYAEGMDRAFLQMPVESGKAFAGLIPALSETVHLTKESTTALKKYFEELSADFGASGDQAGEVTHQLAAIDKALTEMEKNQQKNVSSFKKLGHTIKAEYIMVLGAAKDMTAQFAEAARNEIESTMADVGGSIKGLAEGAAQLAGSRRAEAGVEMVWETAKGIADLAEGSWPPNPAAIIAAGLHFESAAQYGILAGRGSHRAGGGGGGAGGYGGAGGGHGRGGGGGGGYDNQPPQTLAPGAAGAGGRYGNAHVVVFGSNQELMQWVAGTVTAAAQAGHRVVATQSERGAMVGH